MTLTLECLLLLAGLLALFHVLLFTSTLIPDLGSCRAGREGL